MELEILNDILGQTVSGLFKPNKKFVVQTVRRNIVSKNTENQPQYKQPKSVTYRPQSSEHDRQSGNQRNMAQFQKNPVNNSVLSSINTSLMSNNMSFNNHSQIISNSIDLNTSATDNHNQHNSFQQMFKDQNFKSKQGSARQSEQLSSRDWLKIEAPKKLQSSLQKLNLCSQTMTKEYIRTLPAEEISVIKKSVKNELKNYDEVYKQMFGTYPSKEDKEPMRDLYVYYKKLKECMQNKGNESWDEERKVEVVRNSGRGKSEVGQVKAHSKSFSQNSGQFQQRNQNFMNSNGNQKNTFQNINQSFNFQNMGINSNQNSVQLNQNMGQRNQMQINSGQNSMQMNNNQFQINSNKNQQNQNFAQLINQSAQNNLKNGQNSNYMKENQSKQNQQIKINQTQNQNSGQNPFYSGLHQQNNQQHILNNNILQDSKKTNSNHTKQGFQFDLKDNNNNINIQKNKANKEVIEKIDKLKKVRTQLRDKLQKYQDDFYKTHNRKIKFHKDILPVEQEYREYKEIKKEIIKLESQI